MILHPKYSIPPYALAASFGHVPMIRELDTLKFSYQDSGVGLRSALFQASKRSTDDPETVGILLKLIHDNQIEKPCGLHPELLRSDAFIVACLNGHQRILSLYRPTKITRFRNAGACLLTIKGFWVSPP